MKRFYLTGLIAMLTTMMLSGQPVNDNCSNAIEIQYASHESLAVLVSGDTRDATISSLPVNVCSFNFHDDDVWFRFTTPAVLPTEGIQVEAYFNIYTAPDDITDIGMAIYESCDAAAIPVQCFSNGSGKDSLAIGSSCIQANHEYFIRIWSTGTNTASEGTFRIAVFGQDTSAGKIFWEETFSDSLDGWTTYGSCAILDSSHNAPWQYLPNGLLDRGSYIFAGFGILSSTLCDGAVGVDSDYNDTYGIEAFRGPCPAPSTHILESPIIASNHWDTKSLSVRWTQAIRQFMSHYFVSYRTRDANEDWSGWTDVEVNTEFVINGNAYRDNTQLHYLPGAAGHDSIQLKFTYDANYYMWGIDDIQLLQSGYVNDLVISPYPAVAPWAVLPHENQAYPFYALSGIRNAGAETQTEITEQLSMIDVETQTILATQSITYDSISPQTSSTAILFPEPVILDHHGELALEYKVTQLQSEFTPLNNTHRSTVIHGSDFFQLENEYTGAITVPRNLYSIDSPPSFAYGCIYRPAEDIEATSIRWGVHNAPQMEGWEIKIYLIEWLDYNGDLIANPEERTIIGDGYFKFFGHELYNSIFDTWLQNTITPGAPIIMRSGYYYMAMVEYRANTETDPSLHILVSEKRDYGQIIESMDTAYARGLVDHRVFMTALGHNIYGILDSIDYEVRELDPNDNRVYFGDHIVPLIRINTWVASVDDLPNSNSLVVVAPNPAADYITVAFQNQAMLTMCSMQLGDATGKILFQKNNTSVLPGHIEIIDVSHLAPGTFMLSVTADQNRQTIPVIIVR